MMQYIKIGWYINVLSRMKKFKTWSDLAKPKYVFEQDANKHNITTKLSFAYFMVYIYCANYGSQTKFQQSDKY